MTSKDNCRNCNHTKESHKLVVEYPGDPKVLPGTIMYDTHLESIIKCTQCTCQKYAPMDDSDQTWHLVKGVK